MNPIVVIAFHLHSILEVLEWGRLLGLSSAVFMRRICGDRFHRGVTCTNCNKKKISGDSSLLNVWVAFTATNRYRVKGSIGKVVTNIWILTFGKSLSVYM